MCSVHNWHFVVTASQKWKSYSTTCTRIFDNPHLRPVTAHRVQGFTPRADLNPANNNRSLAQSTAQPSCSHIVSIINALFSHTVGMTVKSSCLNCQSFIFSRLLRICLLPGDFTSPNVFDLFNSIIHLKCKFVL